jgi:cell division protein FtsZ
MEYIEGTLIGIGYGTGPDRACQAARSALANPAIQDALLQAEDLSFSLIGGDDLTLSEVNAVAELISQAVSPDAAVNLAAYVRPRRAGEIRVGVSVSRQASA